MLPTQPFLTTLLRTRNLSENTPADRNQAMIEEFVDAIRQGRSPAVTGEDGYKALEIVLAAYQSAEAGEPVKTN